MLEVAQGHVSCPGLNHRLSREWHSVHGADSSTDWAARHRVHGADSNTDWAESGTGYMGPIAAQTGQRVAQGSWGR